MSTPPVSPLLDDLIHDLAQADRDPAAVAAALQGYLGEPGLHPVAGLREPFSGDLESVNRFGELILAA